MAKAEDTVEKVAPEATAEAGAAQDAPGEAAQLQDQVAEKDRLLAEAEDRYKRLYADFENFRRRTRQEKEELANVVAQGLILELLPVLDNFERALHSLDDQEAAGVIDGIGMIHRQLVAALEKAGLSPLETVNQEFDPQYHEAVLRVEDDERPAGTIVEELQKGYSVRGKVIRPSMVKVVG